MAPMITITIMIAIDIGRKYCSVVVVGAVAAGVGVAGDSITLNVVSALEGQ